MTEIISALITLIGTGAFVVLFPEKIEKWIALFWKIAQGINGLKKIAQKKYIKHDIQGRTNDFTKEARKLVPDLREEKLSLEWAEAGTQRESFINEGKVVVRLDSSDLEDHNFVHAAYLYISAAFLYKARRYLSEAQRKALNLYLCEKLLRKEKSSTVGFFLDEYLHPLSRRSKITNYLDAFGQIDRNNLFYPVLVKELHYLGNKVFGRRQDALIIAEVNKLIDFLKKVSNRKIGELHENNVNGNYCKFGIVIVGRIEVLSASINPYINFIRNSFANSSIETIYLLAREEHAGHLEEITEPFLDQYERVDNRKLDQEFRYKSGRTEITKCRLMVLRLIEIKNILPSRR